MIWIACLFLLHVVSARSKCTIILHIGLHKTASTQLQETLGANKALWKKQNVDYQGWIRGLLACFAESGNLTNAWAGFNAGQCELTKSRILREWEQISCTGTQRLIISEEVLSTVLLYDFMMDAFKRMLPTCCSVDVVVFHRSELSRLQSFWNHKVRGFLDSTQLAYPDFASFLQMYYGTSSVVTTNAMMFLTVRQEV